MQWQTVMKDPQEGKACTGEVFCNVWCFTPFFLWVEYCLGWTLLSFQWATESFNILCCKDWHTLLMWQNMIHKSSVWHWDAAGKFQFKFYMVLKQSSLSHLSSCSEFMCICLCLKEEAEIWTAAPSESQAGSPKPAGVWSERWAPARSSKPTEAVDGGAQGRTLAQNSLLKPPLLSDWPDKFSVPFPACFFLKKSFCTPWQAVGRTSCDCEPVAIMVTTVSVSQMLNPS